MAIFDPLGRLEKRRAPPRPGALAAALGEGSKGGALALELAHFLSARPDLLSVAECLAFVAPEPGPPASGKAVRELFGRELGEGPEEVFERFEFEPFDSAPLFQWHDATLAGGQRVTVKICLAPSSTTTAGWPSPAAFARRVLSAVPSVAPHLENLAAAFDRRLRLKMDLTAERQAFSEIGEDEQRPEYLVVPRVRGELSTQRILTCEPVLGGPAAGWTERLDGRGRERRARRLCAGWLRQALAGKPYPLEPSPRTVTFPSSGQVAFTGGPFGRVSRAERETLFEYLAATATDEPERAAVLLLDEAQAVSAELEENLKHRFRHIAPFRDGGWLEDGDRLAQKVLSQWRQSTALELVTAVGVVDFFAGFFRLTDCARCLAPGANVVLAAFQEQRLRRLAVSFRRLLEQGRQADLVERQAALLVDLPQRLDRLLDLASEELDGRRRSSSSARTRRPRQRTAVLTSLLLALATLVMLVGRFGESAWAQGIGALAVLVLGALFVAAASSGS